MKLTKRVLDTLKTTSLRGQRFYDTETRGFGVRVPDGSIHFEVRYGRRRNRHRMAIGRYGSLTIDDAREHAKLLLASAIKGQDPAAARKRAKEMPTFGKWKETYFGRIAGRLKSAKWIDRFLEIADERWKNKPLDSIRIEDAEAFFQKIGEESRTSANRCFKRSGPRFPRQSETDFFKPTLPRESRSFRRTRRAAESSPTLKCSR